jgi:hypothetical protein
MGTLSQWGRQYLLPFAAGQLQPGRAHFSTLFSAMIASSRFQHHCSDQAGTNEPAFKQKNPLDG